MLISLIAARAQEIDDSSDDAPAWISARLILRGTYDDNFMEYSPRDLFELNNGVHPTKFLVKNSVDGVGSVRFRLDLTPPVADPDFRTRLRLRFGRDMYRTNPVKDHDTWSVEINQKISGRNYVYFRITSLPDYYLRNLYYRRYRLLSRYPSHYERANISKNEYSIEIGRRMNARLRLALNYEYDRVSYSPSFAERNNSFHGVRIESDYGAARALRLSLDYGYALRWAGGREDYANAAYDSLPDISSVYHTITAGVNWDIKRLVRLPLTVKAKLMYEHQSFLSGKPGDIYHFGRRDDYWRSSTELEYDLTAYLGLFVEYVWEQNGSNLPETGDAGNFQVHSISTGTAISF